METWLIVIWTVHFVKETPLVIRNAASSESNERVSDSIILILGSKINYPTISFNFGILG